MPSWPKLSATHLAVIVPTIRGTIYSRPPVNSYIMTTKDTVILVTPESDAAAPTIAYNPGLTQATTLKFYFTNL